MLTLIFTLFVWGNAQKNDRKVTRLSVFSKNYTKIKVDDWRQLGD